MGTFLSFDGILGLLVVLACTSASSDVFDRVLGSTASCHNTCQLTYNLHTYPGEEGLFACQRGCRLFSICQFVGDSEDLNQTKSECESTCREAYAQADEQYACILGCQSQLPIAGQRRAQLDSMTPKIHMLQPLTVIRGILEDVMSQAHNFISSTWMFYLQDDEGNIVIFQTDPQIQFNPGFELEKDVKEEELQKISPSFVSPIYKDYLDRALVQERDRDMFADRSINEGDYNLFSCLSRNPWLPGWILTTTLILSVLVLVWICCATVATAVDQYVPAEKLSIYGDMEYMKEQKLTPYPASSLLIVTSTGPEDEAGPLPAKISLDQSDI